MTENLNQKAPNYAGIIRRQRLVIIILFILLTIALILYFSVRPVDTFDYSQLKGKKFSGIVDTSTAHPNMRGYRADRAYLNLSLHRAAKVQGILHDTAAFRTYVNVTFQKFVDTHKAVDGYEWKIGIYPMVANVPIGNNNRPRIGIYLIPTMIKKGVTIPEADPDIIDYFEALANAEYYKIYFPSNLLREDNEFIFDEGHLWP